MPRAALVFIAALGGTVLWSGLAAVPAVAASADAPEIGQWGFDLTGMDRSVKPGDDFFRYANGTWYDHATIPPDRASTGSFLDLSIRSENEVQAIIADLDKMQNPSPIERKVRDLYHSYVDMDRIERLGLAPARADLKAIADVKTYDDVARVMGSVPMRVESLFNVGIGPDDKNPNAYTVFVHQSGLGLPDRDYYLGTDKATEQARTAYHKYIADMLALGGISDPQQKAERIFALETQIAKLHWKREDRRDADKMYNPMTVPQLAVFAPQFPWQVFFHEMGIGKPPGGGDRRVVVGEKSAFPKLAALFAKTPVETWRDYLTFHYLSGHAAYLPKRFDELHFSLYGKVLAGQQQQLARARRGVRFLDRMIGEGVGELYVERYFPPEAKEKARELVGNLLKVYRMRIAAASWMSEETRQKARAKVNNLTIKIGYPDKWRDYTKFAVAPDDLFGNLARGAQFNWHRDLDRLDGPVDRTEWDMAPQTVNAYYDPEFNEIVFPAAILQPPFFDPHADDAVNYGAIGTVIGHEISHGFDDQGSKYDAQGMLQNWWTPADRKNFNARTARLVAQFARYSPLEGVHVNGKLTLGENIADLAGLTIAEAAYRLSLGGRPAPILNGFTGDQRLFLGFAQVWRYKARDADIRRRILTDPHSPPRFRVNGTVRNVDAWYGAYDVQPGQALYLAPKDRVHLW